MRQKLMIRRHNRHAYLVFAALFFHRAFLTSVSKNMERGDQEVGQGYGGSGEEKLVREEEKENFLGIGNWELGIEI